MTSRSGKNRFVSRPRDAESWVKAPEPAASSSSGAYSARLTIDVTPALRGRIKVVAFRRCVTVADMLRDLLAREFADNDGGLP